MVRIAHASKDENGNIKGGKAGDQTGKEVCIRDWYNRPWNVVIRFKDKNMAERFAYAMERAANNPHIGYDQNQRNTALTQARKVNYDPGSISVDCETDCSALVTICCIYAGIPENALYKNGNSATTSVLKARLRATGAVSVFTGKKYTQSPDLLLRGDILLYEGHHVAGVVEGNVASNEALKSVEQIAREVIDGKWGTGSDRKTKLVAAGYDYQTIQSKVNELLKKKETVAEPEQTGPDAIWAYLMDKIGNAYGVAALMGNLRAESALQPTNLQNSANNRLGMTDAKYTSAVDNGTYTNFVKDSAGYGLAQWTYHTRKKALLDFAKASGRSIGDLTMQLDFLMQELSTSYKGVLNSLKSAVNIRGASDIVLTQFERPANQSEAVRVVRTSYGQEYYDKYAGKKSINEIAREVINLKWGYFPERKTRLEAAGYDFEEVQKEVNRILSN